MGLGIAASGVFDLWPGLVGAAVRIGDDVDHWMVHANVAQSNLLLHDIQNFGAHQQVIRVKVGDLVRSFEPMNGQIADVDLQSGEIPAQGGKFNTAAGHDFQFVNDLEPDPVAE